jgi:hypothetical protein
MAVIESRATNNYIHTLQLTCVVPHAATTLTHTTSKWINGMVDRVAFIPSAIATPPASGFAWTLKDNDGVDILKGGGGSCSATLATDLYPDFPVSSQLTLALSGAGTNGSHGYIKIFWRESDNG